MKKMKEIVAWYTKNGIHFPVYKKDESRHAKISHATENRIKQLPKRYGSNIETPTVLTYDEQLAKEADERYQKLAARNKLPEPVKESVYVDTIHTSQDYLNRQKLSELSHRGFNTGTVEPISGVRYKDTVILKDGNHRTSLAKLRSQQKIDVQITNLDKPKRRWFGKKGAK